MNTFFQTLIVGLRLGSIYALVALVIVIFLLTIVVAILMSVNGCIADKKYYERRK